jgi:anaerobic magnesium-protoporphyrin IX monomethyl ester cyclase
MKICLIYTPHSSPVYIPLGISYLKRFIKKNSPSARVKNFDLCNNFHHNLGKKEFLSDLSYLCQICPKNRGSECKGILKQSELAHWINLALIFKTFTTDSTAAEFHDANRYKKLTELYDYFYYRVESCITRVLQHSLETGKPENDIILAKHLFKDDISKISSQDPAVVGFSVFVEAQLCYSLALAKILKTRINSKIVFGGAYISHLDKKALLQHFDFIDFVIYKEGELGITNLLKNLKKGDFTEVPNLLYRKGREVIENTEAHVRNLDEASPPEFNDYKLKNYFTPKPVLSTLFSRGCSWRRCTFCTIHKSFSRPYRTRTISSFIRELEHYQKRGIRHIWLSDEMISAADLESISSAILKKKINMYYGVLAKPTRDFTYDVLKKMYQAGFRIIQWGVESFNQRILDLMDKGTNVQEIKKVLEIASRVGLSNVVLLDRKSVV